MVEHTHTLAQISNQVDKSVTQILSLLPTLVSDLCLSVLSIRIIEIFFAWSCFSTLRRIPKEKRIFPAFLAWFMALPGLGIMMEIIVITYGMPNSLKNYLPSKKRYRSLIAVGSVYLASEIILVIMGMILNTGVIFMLTAVLFYLFSTVLFIWYWIKVIRVKKYLPQPI